MKSYFIFLLLMVFFSIPTSAGVNNILYEHAVDQCKLTISHDAVEGFAGVIMLRSVNKDFGYCAVSKQQVASSLDYAMKSLVSNKNLKEINSVFLGRLRSYKWIGNFLTQESKTSNQWDSSLGRSLVGNDNAYVNATLNATEVLSPFSAPLQKHGYDITDVECEKIMVNKDKLPYEALCWLVITHK